MTDPRFERCGICGNLRMNPLSSCPGCGDALLDEECAIAIIGSARFQAERAERAEADIERLRASVQRAIDAIRSDAQLSRNPVQAELFNAAAGVEDALAYPRVPTTGVALIAEERLEARKRDALRAEVARLTRGHGRCDKCGRTDHEVAMELKDGVPIDDPAGFTWCHACHCARVINDLKDELGQALADINTMAQTVDRLKASSPLEGHSCPNCGGGPLVPEPEESGMYGVYCPECREQESHREAEITRLKARERDAFMAGMDDACDYYTMKRISVEPWKDRAFAAYLASRQEQPR